MSIEAEHAAELLLEAAAEELRAAFPAATWEPDDLTDAVSGTVGPVFVLVGVARDGHGWRAEVNHRARTAKGWGPSPVSAVRAAATRALALPYLSMPPRPRLVESPPRFAPGARPRVQGDEGGPGGLPATECDQCDGDGFCRACGGTGFVR